MRIILFTLTGFGNKVFDSLTREACEIGAVFTRKEKGPFPYYKEKNLGEYIRSRGIKVYEEFSWDEVEKIVKEISPRLILVATFHRIIPRNIISIIPYCVNLHPSLLPKYRGPTPVEWALHYEEKKTGVTAHFLSSKVDGGDILIQREILISKEDNRNILRKKLACLAGEVAQELVEQIETGTIKPRPQNETEATYFPKYKTIKEID